MTNLQTLTLILSITLISFSGCTQIVTAPIGIASSVVGATIDVAGATVDAVSCSEDDKEED